MGNTTGAGVSGMDRTEELLRASFSRLEGLIGEVRDLRYKIKSVQGDVESLRAALKGGGSGGPTDGGGSDASADGGGAQGSPGASAAAAGAAEPGTGGGGPEAGSRSGTDRERQVGHGEGSSAAGTASGSGENASGRGTPGGGTGLEQRLRRIENRLEYLASKWLELDEKVYVLQKKGGANAD